jgi:hypothetical protein
VPMDKQVIYAVLVGPEMNKKLVTEDSDTISVLVIKCGVLRQKAEEKIYGGDALGRPEQMTIPGVTGIQPQFGGTKN